MPSAGNCRGQHRPNLSVSITSTTQGKTTMRLLLFDDHKLGVWNGQQVLDASAAVAGMDHHSPQEMMEMLIRDWADIEPRIRGRCRRPRPASLWRTFAVALRFPGRASWSAWRATIWNRQSRNGVCSTPSSNPPTPPMATAERSSCLPRKPVSFTLSRSWPWSSVKRASRIAAEDALDHVFGYTQFIDVSARGLPGGFFLGKSWHTFAPMGPLLVDPAMRSPMPTIWVCVYGSTMGSATISIRAIWTGIFPNCWPR